MSKNNLSFCIFVFLCVRTSIGFCRFTFLCYGRDEHLLYLDTFFKNHSVRIVRAAFYEQLNPVFCFRTIFESLLQFLDKVAFVLQAICLSHSCADTRAREHKLIDKHGFAFIDFDLIAEFDDVESKRFRFLSERTFHTISPLCATDMIAPNRRKVNSVLSISLVADEFQAFYALHCVNPNPVNRLLDFQGFFFTHTVITSIGAGDGVVAFATTFGANPLRESAIASHFTAWSRIPSTAYRKNSTSCEMLCFWRHHPDLNWG